MPPESLEEIRLLSNLETASHKLVNIMLFGQPELDALLAEPRLRQVRDRVIHRFELQPLPPPEASAYIDHRLRAAGWKGGALFTPPAMALLVKASAGRARRINLLADKSLLGAYACGAMVVDVHHVKDALGELHADTPGPRSKPWMPLVRWGASSLALAVTMTVAALWLLDQRRLPAVQSAAPVAATAPAAPPPSSAPAATQPAVELAESPPPQPAAAPSTVPVKNVQPPTSAALPAATDAFLQSYLARTQALLQTPNLDGYTIQLAALPRDASVAGYLNSAGHLVDSSMVYVQLSTYNGRNFVSVYYGHFGTTAQASAAMAGLPTALKTNKPIVRTWARIKQDQIL